MPNISWEELSEIRHAISRSYYPVTTAGNLFRKMFKENIGVAEEGLKQVNIINCKIIEALEIIDNIIEKGE